MFHTIFNIIFNNLYILYYYVYSLNRLQNTCGVIPNVKGLGNESKHVVSKFMTLRKEDEQLHKYMNHKYLNETFSTPIPIDTNMISAASILTNPHDRDRGNLFEDIQLKESIDTLLM